MAEPGEYIEIAGGKITHTCEDDFVMYSGGNIVINAGKSVIWHGEEGVVFGDYQEPPDDKHKTKNRIVKLARITNHEVDLFDIAKFKVVEYEQRPSDADKNSIHWLIEYGNHKQKLKTRNEQLSLYIGDKNAYDAEIKVFAYLQRLNPQLCATVKVRRVSIKPRSAWNPRVNRTGKGFDYEQITAPLETFYDTIVIHHSGNSKHFPTMREIQNEHMDGKQRKADIGYHFGIDKNGNIYEGRPIDIKGAHVERANTGKIGIVLLADLSTDNAGMADEFLGSVKLSYEEEDGDDYVTDQMEKSLLKLCIHLDLLYAIDAVAGHMEIAASAGTSDRYCPGNLTMAKMDAWRKILDKKKP